MRITYKALYDPLTHELGGYLLWCNYENQ